MAKIHVFICFFLFITTNCGNSEAAVTSPRTQVQGEVVEEQSEGPAPVVRPAAFEMETYLPSLKGKRVALLVNQTSTLGGVHLVDTLLASGIDVRKIFAPEHGFRGGGDAGTTIKDGKDQATGLPIKSLYGKNKKPTEKDLSDVDIILFDIQDVGARFYTYISSLYYVLEAAGRHGKTVMILDRPNPNGHYIDGPILDMAHQSFVGIAPIPVVHGLTVAEFAQMAIGEGWIPSKLAPKLVIIPMKSYTHATPYELPVPPSPNLPNQLSIYLYPSLCFFEGTAVSVGRGTNNQFQVYGHPKLPGQYTFTPVSGPGSKYPKLENKECRGVILTGIPPADIYTATNKDGIEVDMLVRCYRSLTDAGVEFFTRPDFFDLLAGGPGLREAILRGDSAEQIKAGWLAELFDYREMREGYLLYP
ncbi:MAG: hypothetical protein ACJAZ9_000705 [Neolewinella sp.]|jgi:uncharacterized protein YbbC (DUF1343 family)